MPDISIERMRRYRRDLHKIPELDSDLPQTQTYVTEVLSGLKCHVFSPIKSAVCAFFDFGRSDALAFRSDMDALPITERTGLPFASTREGCMHACGHDGHMAALLELANIIDSSRDMPHNILLIFQPAEETTGGAKYICESGVFDKYNVRAVFGLHLWPSLPAGRLSTRPGGMLAKSSEINVRVSGKSAHIARAEEGRDSLEAAARFLLDAYKMVDSEFPPEERRLLKFGHMTSGRVRNAISAETLLEGSMRAFSLETFGRMRSRLEDIAGEIAGQSGCRFDIELSEGYPPVVNDPALYDAVSRFLGDDMPALLPEPFMISEDFSYYGLCRPSLFFLLGTGRDCPLHSDTFDFDEEILASGAKLFASLAMMP